MTSSLPAPHLRTDRPDDAGRVGARHVIGLLVHVEGGNGLAEGGPDAVVVDARRHHEDEDLIVADRPGRNDFDLHRLLGRAVALLADGPGMHLLRDIAERRNFPERIEILAVADLLERLVAIERLVVLVFGRKPNTYLLRCNMI